MSLELVLGMLLAASSAVGQKAATTNPVRDTDRPFNIGVLAQGGFGVTEDRGSFRFFMAGARAGKVLTTTAGKGCGAGILSMEQRFFRSGSRIRRRCCGRTVL